MMRKENFVGNKIGQTAPFASLSRREFLKRMGLMGGGLIVYCTIGDITAQARAPREGYAGSNVPYRWKAALPWGWAMP